MSRIGKLPITIPSGVKVEVSSDNTVTMKGPNGQLSQKIDPDLKLEMEGSVLQVTRPTDQKRHRAAHGLYRSLLSNMAVGVSTGYTIEQELVGVGYKAENNGQLLDLTLGYSHHIVFDIPKEVKVETKTEKRANPIITLKSADKQLIGQVAAKIRSLRPPEPYKGKGIKFVKEELRRKAGKSAGK